MYYIIWIALHDSKILEDTEILFTIDWQKKKWCEDILSFKENRNKQSIDKKD